VEIEDLLREAHLHFIGRAQNQDRCDHQADGRERKRDGKELFHPLSTSSGSNAHSDSTRKMASKATRNRSQKRASSSCGMAARTAEAPFEPAMITGTMMG